MWLSNHIESADFRPLSTFRGCDMESIAVTKDYLPTRWANQIVRGYDRNDHHDFENMMNDKYVLAGLDPAMWTDLELKQNIQRRIELFYKKTQSKNYILVNNHSQAGTIDIKEETDLSKVYMNSEPGYTLIDWMELISYAIEFHTVSTSTFYLLQAMKNAKMNMPKIFIYPRPNSDGLRGISKLNPTFEYTPML